MSAQIFAFRGKKKRGAKVRRGPCAQMLHFPAPLGGANLYAEWNWLFDHHRDWSDEKLPEPEDLADFDQVEFARRRWISDAVREGRGRAPKTDDDLRQDVSEWRAQIERRVQMKDWLETFGVNWEEVRNTESALFFVFDRLHAQIPLESA